MFAGVEGRRNARAREAAKDDAAIRVESSVAAFPKRRASGERQQRRQVIARLVHQINAQLRVFHPDVYVRAEDQQLLCQHAHIFRQTEVAVEGREL